MYSEMRLIGLHNARPIEQQEPNVLLRKLLAKEGNVGFEQCLSGDWFESAPNRVCCPLHEIKVTGRTVVIAATNLLEHFLQHVKPPTIRSRLEIAIAAVEYPPDNLGGLKRRLLF